MTGALPLLLADSPAHFTPIDWTVLAVYMLFTTLLGGWLAGKQTTIREFFLAGRKIHWLAVAGSSIATEISAVTLIAVPALVFKPGGNLTYLQFMIGALLARVIIAVWFVPAFYEREIFSPYDYMGRRLGPRIKAITTGLFVLGAILGQSVRVLLTAVVLQEISGLNVTASIWIIGLAAVIWTMLGGMTTVIWTDVIQFFVFLVGMITALIAILTQVNGGWSEVLRMASTGDPAGNKLTWLNLGPSDGDWYALLQQPYTLWAAIIGNTTLCLAAYGTDQMMAQRIFCCRGKRQAQYAVLAGGASLFVALLAVGVGLGLFAFYQHHPLNPADAAQVAAQSDKVFQKFLVQQIPVGVRGLIIAGVFAAAISTLESVLAALSQVVITGFYQPWREAQTLHIAQPKTNEADSTPAPSDDSHYLLVSRGLVVIWAIALCLAAQVSIYALERYKQFLDLALAMATYTAGPMLAAFLLSLSGARIDSRGLVWSTPLAILMVFSLAWHDGWAQTVTLAFALIIVAARVMAQLAGKPVGRGFGATLLILATAGLVCFVSRYQLEPGQFITAAWPWYAPVGFIVAFTLGYVLAGHAPRDSQERSRAVNSA